MSAITTPAGRPIRTPAGQVIECACGTCYGCERKAIDDMALYIYAREMRICDGMMTDAKLRAHAQRMADQYRYPRINALALRKA